MDEMKNKIIQIIESAGLNSNLFLIGVGKSNTKKENGFTYKYDSKYNILENSKKYAIKYFPEYDFCLIWNVYGMNKNGQLIPRSNFSLSSECVKEKEYDGIAEKGIEFIGRYKEKVIISPMEKLPEYLKTLKK